MERKERIWIVSTPFEGAREPLAIVIEGKNHKWKEMRK